MSNYCKMLMAHLSKPQPGMSLRPDQLGLSGLEGLESERGCEQMAYLLFMLIREHHGDKAAHLIFAKWAKPASAAKLALIANIGLLQRLYRMKPKPNVQRLACELAIENKSLPRAKQRGAGSTNPITLEKLIRRTRDFHIKKGKRP